MEEVNKPLLAVVVIQSIYAGYFVITKLAFDVGMNTFVFVFYRQAAATLFLAPIAIFFERKSAPPLSFSIFIKIFLLSLCGITMSLDIVGVGLKYTSASLGAASSNTVPVVTFFLAVLLRMEKVKIRRRSGMMKVAGVSLCMGGVATIAFYRGPFLKILTHHHLINNHLQRLQDHVPSPTTWIKGVFLMLLSSFSWALWLVLQGRVLKVYPSKLLLTTLQCFMSTIQSLLVAVAFTRDPNDWQLGWNIRLLSVAYCTKVLSILVGTAQFCRPGETVSLAENEGSGLNVLKPFIFIQRGRRNYTFSFIGYKCFGSTSAGWRALFVLWGKTKEEEREEESCQPPADVEKPFGGGPKGDTNV
ncbi:UNVERIFIED_CONTAM: WAT1-related protein [Sesamum calycinum]|uniref:WAT1-related protein n=1 Tax=Sesamum calycinum TaxID=2727403 RepID=A0AAW2MN61_9LAMI